MFLTPEECTKKLTFLLYLVNISRNVLKLSPAAVPFGVFIRVQMRNFSMINNAIEGIKSNVVHDQFSRVNILTE